MNIKIRDIGETVWVIHNNTVQEMEIIGLILSLNMGAENKWISVDRAYDRQVVVKHSIMTAEEVSDKVWYSLKKKGLSDEELKPYDVVGMSGKRLFSTKAELLASL